MSKFLGVLSVLVVLLLAMGFAAANAGHRVTIDLGLFTLYQVPVTLVAFSGLFVGMVAMFLTGVHTDLKVRRILRDRFAEESRQERTAIDMSQQDLFGGDPGTEDGPGDENLLDTGEESGPEASETDPESGPEVLEAEPEFGPEHGVQDPAPVFDEVDTEAPPPEVERPSDPHQVD